MENINLGTINPTNYDKRLCMIIDQQQKQFHNPDV